MKEFLETIIKDILPDKIKLFSNINLSRQTMCCQINDISNGIIVELRSRNQDFKYFSFVISESIDISDTVQFLIFVRGVSKLFRITEKMLNVIYLKSITKREDIFYAIENC